MRDYKTEHKIRTANKKRVLAELDKDKAVLFLDRLKADGGNYTSWLLERIENYMSEKS